MSGLLLAEPAMVSPRTQMSVARYTDTLYRAQLSEQERAEMLFQRGIAYDSMGLISLARSDYASALALNPALADAHNSLGVIYTQAGMHMMAYEAFDSTLEIKPDYDFAYLNRGIALYYGGRSQLAINDTQLYMDKDPTDPFRVLWHYIIYRDSKTEAEAKTMLSTARRLLDDENWATSLVDFYLGNVEERDVIATLVKGVTSPSQLNYRLCEAYFYLGKYNALLEYNVKAVNYFKLALSTNVYEYVEHKYARIELDRSQQAQFESIRAE